VDAVLEECTKRAIGLVVPTIDTELPVYAAACRRFAETGVVVCISAPATVQICCDKIATHDWLVANGFPTVRQTGIQTALKNPAAWQLPLIVKPFNGSASIGVRRVQTRLELEAIERVTSGYIVQEIAPGREFTVNAYVNREGQCVCALPHWRMEVRAGEVSKGITMKDRCLMDLAREVASKLPGAYGPLNIQCFVDEAGKIKIIEMNARFGGGYPLAHRAGARFTDWLLDEWEGKRLSYFEGWTDDLAMLRYDEAVYVPGSMVRT
jgi:carbamoyl-phosphate synthase large subunit